MTPSTPSHTAWTPAPIVLDPALTSAATALIEAIETAASNPEFVPYPSLVHVLLRRAQALRADVMAAQSLNETGVRVVIVAPMGAGKSSILTGLMRTWAGTPRQLEPRESGGDHLQRMSVLPLGAGGTTPCEVHFQHADAWTVSVEREHEAQVLARVNGVAGWAMRKATPNAGGHHRTNGELEAAQDREAESDERVPEAQSNTSRLLLEPMPGGDIRRYLTGACGLNDAKLVALAHTCLQVPDGAELLRDEIVRKLDYPQRGAFEASPPSDAAPMAWLKHLLEQLTWGRWPSQPFPSRIVVRGPGIPRIQESPQPLRLVDSLGLPAVLKAGETPLRGRKDLDTLLRDPWAIAMFVSGFANPPEPMTAALINAFSGQIPLVPAHRALLPVLYKGESVPFDDELGDTREQQRSREAVEMQTIAIEAVNQLLAQHKKPESWTREQSPVVDLLGALGSEHGIATLDAALNARLMAMGAAWETNIRKEIDAAAHLLENVTNAPVVIGEVIDALNERTNPSRAAFRDMMDKLKSCPVLPFAVACGRPTDGGYLHWGCVNDIGRNHGDGHRNAFLLLRADVEEDYLEPVVTTWKAAIKDAQISLFGGASDWERDVINFVVNAETDRATKLMEVLPAAFEAAFKSVAGEKACGPNCIWEGGPGSIMGVRYGSDRPLPPFWRAGIEAWGRRHQQELWSEVEAYLAAHHVTLPD